MPVLSNLSKKRDFVQKVQLLFAYVVCLFQTSTNPFSVDNQGNGYYDYTFIDMGIKGKNRVKIIVRDQQLLIDEIQQLSPQY